MPVRSELSVAVATLKTLFDENSLVFARRKRLLEGMIADCAEIRERLEADDLASVPVGEEQLA